MKASDLMTLGAATVRPDASLFKAIETMIHHRISALPVVDEKGMFSGILTEGDIMRAIDLIPGDLLDMAADARKKVLCGNHVTKFMTVGAVAIGPDASLDDARALMKTRALRRLPVVADGKVLGVLSRADILNALVA